MAEDIYLISIIFKDKYKKNTLDKYQKVLPRVLPNGNLLNHQHSVCKSRTSFSYIERIELMHASP